jgi:hypothetical protein
VLPEGPSQGILKKAIARRSEGTKEQMEEKQVVLCKRADVTG